MIYSAAGNEIYAWRRGSELKHVYKGHEYQVKLLLPFGPHLISIDSQSQLRVFEITTEKQVLHLEFNKKIFDISCVCHPITYQDKILLGSNQGQLQLWNLKSGKRIYKFKGWNSAVTCLGKFSFWSKTNFQVSVIYVIWKRASESTTLNFQWMECQSEINFYVFFLLFGSETWQRHFLIVRYLGLWNVRKITKNKRKIQIDRLMAKM